MKSNKKGNHLYAYKDTIRRLFLLTLFSFLIVESYAQNKTISGTVTDFTGEPVIGASVLVNGTTNGTITDLNGKFSLSNVPIKGTITLTYIGYKKQEVSVAGNTNFKITLQEDTETLDEVVVVGYGVQKKSDVTGAMARVGEKEFDPSLKGAWRSAIIAICDAAERFSETKTGALIVLERHTNLSEIVRTGTPVNSAVNLEVLGTIFYEGTPLHDGAAIIENGRIKAAGCVLPLSNNLDLGKDMGTRHRACLGIAENSDAIAIVVSEETGIISMAKNGVLIRHFDRQSLYPRLIDEMIPKEPTVEKSTADTWKDRVKGLMKWVSQKGEDEQQ